ncbi:unnamed protein product [Chilo suppressalis]|uniref:Major facilitator superfamily (MFS) profile domain-containing protein n=1 Tax=Chilo suppressalis TaxID=168631 RepID=A0ABN8L5N4_CHISP|nr:unnamed protein product [Chilo suppressalis]
MYHRLKSRVVKYLFIVCFGSHRSMRKSAFGQRHVQVVLIFFGLVLAYAMRVNMSLAIVAMTDPHAGGNSGGWQLVVVCRVLQGLFQGVTFPSVHNLLGKWVPVEEKSRLGQFVYAGSQLGTALQLITAGYIADQWGWPMIFYSVGILGAIWTLFYLKLGAASPQSSNTISPDERGYIESSLGTVQVHKKLQTPWKAIMTSKQFLALVLVHCGQNWGFWTLLTEIPSYMELVLKVNIKSNGVLSALPYLMMFILSFVFSIILEHCHNKQLFSLSTSRKISNSIGFYGAAAALIGIVYAPSHSLTASVALLAIAVGVNAGHITGLVLVHIDMAPNFAGSLMGVTNGLANIVSIVAPLVAAIILKDESDPKFWKVVFFLAAAVYVLTNTIFIIFGTSERQPWNDPSDEYKPLS